MNKEFQKVLDDLRMIGHLHIHSHIESVPYFDYKRIGWKVHYHINLGDGFEIKFLEKRDLEDIIRDVHHEAMTWLSFCYPDHFVEIMNGSYYNADEPRIVPARLGEHQQAD